MKNFITCLLIITSFTYSFSQTFDCNGDPMVTFQDLSCDGSFMTFTVITSSVANSRESILHDLPMDSEIAYPPNPNNFSLINMHPFEIDNETIYIRVPTTECTQLLFTLTMQLTGKDPLCTENVTLEIEAATVIPTLGQWGLIILGLGLVIFGTISATKKNELKTT